MVNRQSLSGKKHVYCDLYGGGTCGAREDAKEKRLQQAPRMDDKSRAIDHTGERIGSLDVLRKDGVIEQQYRYLHNHRHYDAFTVYDKYLCKCYLCGKEYNIRGDKLSINPPSDYGYNAYNGYYCEAKCDCHPQSSLQWKINKAIIDSGLDYSVEYKFNDLLGLYGVNKLSFDFAVFKDSKLIALIEGQGKQHFEASDEFGGKRALGAQKANDQAKRDYCAKHSIKLLEISFKLNYQAIFSIIEQLKND